jgi:6-phosphogluconolactonase
MSATIKTFDDPDALASAFARDFIDWLSGKEHIYVALSGGSTPQRLFHCWATEDRARIDWRRIHFFWGDERCVPPDHPESNFGMTQKLLFDHIDIPQENIHRIRGENEPEAEALRYAEEIEANVPLREGHPVFDVILLGMGEDGHTASIFPDNMALLKSDQVCAVATHPQSGQKRVSLTGSVINDARQVVFLITGAGKASVLREVVNHDGHWEHYPAAFVDPAGALYFYVDAAAASEL